MKWVCYHPQAASGRCGDVEPHWTVEGQHWHYDIFRIVNESGWKYELHGTVLSATTPENGQLYHPFATVKEAMHAAAQNEE